MRDPSGNGLTTTERQGHPVGGSGRSLPELAFCAVTTPAVPGALDRLRRATRERHERLDVGVAFAVDRLDAEGYAEHLRRMASVVAPVEAAIGQAVARDPALAGELRARRRAELLERDLLELDHAMPSPAPVPRLDGVAAALGATYVLEGSTLGGRVLAARARAALGAAAPVRFLTAGGADVPARWASTRALLVERLGDDGELQRATCAAVTVFDAFIEVLVR